MNLSAEGLLSGIEKHADTLAFLFQISEKDVAYAQQQNLWDGYSLQEKLEFLVDVVGGRTLGFNLFPKVAKFQSTFNLGGAINKTSEVGAILWGLSEAGLIGAKWAGIGKKVLFGGAIGGVFDAPVSYGLGQGQAQAMTVASWA